MWLRNIPFSACLLLACCGTALAQASPQPDTSSGASLFPSNYRVQIAVELARDYAKDGRGPAEITATNDRRGGLLATEEQHGAAIVCVQYPVDRTWGMVQLEGQTTRAIVYTAINNTLTFGKTQYKRTKNDRGPSKCDGATTRFTELEALSARLKDCVNKTQKSCSFVRL